MSNANFTPPIPQNEPVLSYKAGSPERIELEKELQRQQSSVTKIPLYINGEHVFTDQQEEVRCPHNHSQVIASASCATKGHVASAIDSAVKAQKEWGALPWEARASVFLKAAELLSGKYRAEMNAATMLGQAKTVHQAEIDASCELADFFRFNVYYASQIMAMQPSSSAGIWNRSEVRGLEGFVYAVSPFNFTSIAVNLPCAPALMGCSSVWKPAPTSMHGVYVGLKILEEAGLPKGVINMVGGDPKEISSIVMPNKHLAGVHFTGSTATFNHLWQEVGQNLSQYRSYPRIVGETGGKDFVFAHNSASIPQLATALVRGAFEYQGQKCSAASRAFIPKSIWPELKELLCHEISTIKVGDVTDFSNFMSAVIDAKSYQKIKSYIDDARQSDEAEILIGGDCNDSLGYFVQPTVIVAKSPSYKTMIEEIFGPVLSIFVYDDDQLEETIKLCDESTPYALTGAIFAKDRHTINDLCKALSHAAGNFYINDKPTGAVVGQQPFGGGRASGTNDKAGSLANLLRWTSLRTIKENFQPITDYRYPFMD